MDKELITAAFDAVVCIFDAMEGIGSRGGAQGRQGTVLKIYIV